MATLLEIFGPQCSSIMYSIWPFKHFFYSSVTDESYVEETRVWRKYEILILIIMMSLFAGIRLRQQFYITIRRKQLNTRNTKLQ